MELDEIKALMEMLKDSDVTDLQVEKEGYKVRLKREKAVVEHSYSVPVPSAPPAAAKALPAPEAEDMHGLVTVTAPLVGTFYKSATPDADPFVDVGDRVRKGQVICIVEAMKLMNEIECEVSGIVKKCLVDNSQPVEYGEPLFLVEPD